MIHVTLPTGTTKRIEDPGDVVALLALRVPDSYGPWHFFEKTEGTRLRTDGSNIRAVVYALANDPQSRDTTHWIANEFHRISGLTLFNVLTLPNAVLPLLCSLTAIALGKQGETVAIDQPENGMHPRAVQELVVSARTRSESTGVRVCFTTYSPALLNMFDNEPNQVWLSSGGEAVCLTELFSIEWLGNFTLGNLYLQGELSPMNAGMPRAK